MDKDKHITKVVFRTDKRGDFKGSVTAWFPELSHVRTYRTNLYAHIGQHGEGDYKGCLATSRPSTLREYKDLKRELEGLGYNLKVLKRAKLIYK